MAPNASEMKENHPFWVRTHFGYFKTWFGVIILLFYHYCREFFYHPCLGYRSRLWRVPATLPYPDFFFTTRTLPGFFLKILGFRVVSIHAVFSHWLPQWCQILVQLWQLFLFKRSIRTECKSNGSSIATSKRINNCIFPKKKRIFWK